MKKRLLFLISLFSIISYSGIAQSESDIVITEILYNQPGPDTLEFVEIYNKGAAAINLQGYEFTRGFSYTFPSYTLEPGSYAVIARYPEFANDFFGITALQWESGGLDNSGETIVLKDASGKIADSVTYADSSPWPLEADGEGASLELCHPTYENSSFPYWGASTTLGGLFEGEFQIFASPGKENIGCYSQGDKEKPKANSVDALTLSTVRIVFSEPVVNASNLANYSGLSIEELNVSDSRDTVLLTLTAPIEANTRRTLTITNLQDTAQNISLPESFFLGYNVSKPELVINEIMYDQPGNDTLEFIEVYYAGAEPAALGGIKFEQGVRFVFPEMNVNPGDYIVIAANPETIEDIFNITGVLQWENGNLSNNGEKISIENSLDDLIDEVSYLPVSPWPTGAAGTGNSLTLCSFMADNSLAATWTTSETEAGIFDGATIYASPGKPEEKECALSTRSRIEPSSIVISPLPSNGNIQITSENALTKKVEIFNLTGKVIFTSQFNQEYDLTLPDDVKGQLMIKITAVESGDYLWKKMIVH